jgi:riboflavin synthase
MFTGLVEAQGTLASREARGSGFRIRVEAAVSALELGESIAVSGVCLTVTASDARGFHADVSLETVERTTLGQLELGAKLNLERSLKVGDRLGGHLLSGHVDAVANVRSAHLDGEASRVVVSYPNELGPFIAVKGSVALDGVSLTVNAVTDSTLEVTLIPHTRQVTTLGDLTPGRPLNLEVDMLARYAVRYLESHAGALARSSAVAVAPGRERVG